MRRTKETTKEETPIDTIMAKATAVEPLSIEEMPLESLGDYMRYNAEARKLNKKLRICRHQIKQCPIELHPTERIIFGRKDQPSNPLPVYLSNEMIEYKEKLIPGKTYDLPRCVVEYLAEKGTSIWGWFDNPDGSKETRVANKEPRFALRTIYKD